MSNRLAVYFAFFLSGLAGLIYQVVWVRFFGNVFGNTVQSASVVTAVFMLGLGIGSWAAGRWIDKRPDSSVPLRAYGTAEALIGLGGLLLALVLPQLGPSASLISSYHLGADGWQHVSATSYVALGGVAVVLLLPITMLMGATLTLLIRHILHTHLEESGWRVGLLYGANTGGAALGAFATDFALVPVVGLFATASLAAVANFAAALIALRLPQAEDIAAPRPPAATVGAKQTRPLFIALAIATTGFAAMGFEIVWFRFLNVTMGGYRAVFSFLLATILASMWLGSVIGGAIHRKVGRPGTIFILAQAAVVLSTLLLLQISDPHAADVRFATESAADYMAAGAFSKQVILATWQIGFIAALVGLPACLMGFAYPLSNALIQDAEASIGSRAGFLYFANTVGAVLGSLVAGFILLPHVGTQDAALVLAVGGVVALPLIFLGAAEESRQRVTRAALALGLTLASVGIAAWTTLEPDDIMLRHAVPDFADKMSTIDASEGLYEVISVTEDEHGFRRLNTNGHSMSATTPDAQRYMRLFAHFPLLHMEAPESALIICFGVGNTVNATSRHPSMKQIDIADLSEHVLSKADHFTKWNDHVLRDPRVNVFVQDGRSHLRSTAPDTYDLVTLEPPPLRHAGVASLYSREFYELAKSRLKDGGFVTQWLPIYQLPAPVVLAVVRAFLDVFPDAILLSGAFAELILVGRKDMPVQIELDTLLRRIDARPAVAADLERVWARTATDFIGLFVSGPTALARATVDAASLTDDLPTMEYASPSKFFRHVVPPGLFAPEQAREWCTTCWVNGQPDPRIAEIDDYHQILNGILESPQFRIRDTFIPPARQFSIQFPAGLSPQSPVVRHSPWLSEVFRPPANEKSPPSR